MNVATPHPVRFPLLASVIAVGITASAAAQTDSDTQSTEVSARAADDGFRIALHDGDVAYGRFARSALTVVTEFGTLNVPLDRIRSITPGLHNRPELKRQISEWIDELGAETKPRREAAQRSLIGLGPAVRLVLQRHVDDPNGERVRRIREVLAEFDQLQEQAGEAVPAWIDEDTVHTTHFTIVGRIDVEQLRFQTKYGDLTFQLAHIVRVQSGTEHQQRLAGRPGPSSKERELLKRASVDGKYKGLLRKFEVPQDLANYGEFSDYGYYTGTSYAGYDDLPIGFWVYVHPHWYIWGEQVK